MNMRDVLAENFKRLRTANPKLYSLKDITKAGGGSNGTLGRISAKQAGISIDKLEDLAQAYGLEAWQLLVPNLDPENLPKLASEEPWPLELVDQDRYEALSPMAQGAAQKGMMDEIAAQEELASRRQANGSVR